MRGRRFFAVSFLLLLHGALEAAAVAGQTQPAVSQTQTVPDLSGWIGRTVTLVRVEIEGRPVAQAIRSGSDP